MSNGPADKTLDELKSLLWDAIILKVAKDWAINIALKWLGKVLGEKFAGLIAGPFGMLASFLFSYFGDKIYKGMKDYTNIKMIEFLNEKEQKEFDRASAKLKAIARENGIDSEEFKKQERITAKEFSDFIKFGIVRDRQG